MAEIVTDLPFAEYGKRLALSSTMISRRDRASWAHVRAGHGPSDGVALIGRAAHAALLQPDVYAATYRAWPSADGIKKKDGTAPVNPRATTEYKALCSAERAAYPDAEFLDDEDRERIDRMTASARDVAGQYLEGLVPEASIFFDINGQACKSRPDGVRVAGGLVFEYKTCESAEPQNVAWDIKKWRYGLQMAFQGIAYREAFGHAPSDYVIVAVEKEPPYGCTVHELSLCWIAELEERCIEYVDEFKQLCEGKPAWPGYSRAVHIIDFSKGDE